MEEGVVTDNTGRKINFNNCIIILTGNIGSEKAAKPNIGFGQATSETIARDKLIGELKSFFRPEFLNRLNEIVLFNSFGIEELSKITKLELEKVAAKLEDKGISMSATPSVYRLLAQKAVDEKMGARPIKRLIQKNIENELSRLILDKSLHENTSIKFSVNKDELKYTITEEEV